MTYRFHGQTIKLTHEDYDRWKSRFHAIPDLEAALWSLDDYYTSEEVKNWFIRCSAALVKQHQKWVLERKPSTAADESLTRPVTEQEARIYMREKPWLFNYNPDDEAPVKRVPVDWRPKLRAV